MCIILGVVSIIMIVSTLFVSLTTDKPFEEINCFVTNITTNYFTDAIIGNYTQTIIYYRLRFKTERLSLTNKIFYNGDIDLDNQNFIAEYGKMNKKYVCMYRKNFIDYVYTDKPNKKFDHYWTKNIIICSTYVIFVFILVAIFSPSSESGDTTEYGDEFD